jgi:threonine synthase
MVRGFQDLRSMGLTDRLPRIVAAEPYGAYGAGLSSPRRWDEPQPTPEEATVAFSIASLVPSWQGLWALRATGGSAESATNAEVLQAQQDLARMEGLYSEPSSAIAYAVLPKLIKDGRLREDEAVVIVGSSTGLKDVGATDAFLPGVRVPASATLDAVSFLFS